MRRIPAALFLLAAVAAGCVAGPRGPSVEPAGEGEIAARLDAGRTVRVAVAPAAGTVVVEGTSLVAADLAGGRGALAGRPGASRLEARAASDEVVLDGRPTGAARLGIDGVGSLHVTVNHGPPRELRGRLVLVARGATLVVVNEIPLERYLAGVVSLEMDAASWPMEALKAQAVASRTYAMHRIDLRRRSGGPWALYDLETTVLDQVYAGARAEHPRAREAVAATAGQWLAGPDGEPILAAFHSTAGGMTEAAEEVWGSGRPYLVAQRCPYDHESPAYEWELVLPVAEVERQLREAGLPVRGVAALETLGRTAGGRVRLVRIAGAAEPVGLEAAKLREILGWSRLKSTAFEVTRDGDDFRFRGRGYGHGVGMCQWGARGMALAGHDYREILEYYYPGVTLETGGGLRPSPDNFPGHRSAGRSPASLQKHHSE